MVEAEEGFEHGALKAIELGQLVCQPTAALKDILETHDFMSRRNAQRNKGSAS